MPDQWLVGVGAALTAFALTPLIRSWHLSRNLIDLPDPRRSHQVPTPRGGGVAVVAAILLALLIAPVSWTEWWLPALFVSALGVLGWIDDHTDLSPAVRLAVQAGLVAAVLWALGGISALNLFGHAVSVPLLWTVLGGIAAIWLINLHNFMDGSDGLAAMQGLFSAALLSGILAGAGLEGSAWFGLAVAGAYAGFLIWNRPPARIFMGDAGSLALGGAIAWLALVAVGSGKLSIYLVFMTTSVFVVDASATLLLRVWRRERWYTPHREHAYQRLIAAGWSHGRVLALYALTNFCLVLPAVLVARIVPWSKAPLAAVLALVLLLGWGVIQSATRTEKPRA